MSFDAKAGFTGLVTATAEAGGSPQGLRIADNVTLRREGALIPRPVFASSALPRTYLAAFPYSTSLVYIASGNVPYDASTNAYSVQANDSVAPVRADVFGGKEARKNFYFATKAGVLRASSPSPPVFYRSGTIPTETAIVNLQLNGSGTDHLLTTGQQVAYRTVLVKTDPNGVITRGRPSGATLAVATGTQSPQIQIMFNAYAASQAVSRVVELYRTRVFPAGVQVDDEMQLVATLEFPVGSSTSLNYFDKIPDARRGVTLYTSPSRGGIENANDRPPGCACLERYRGSLFFGNTVGPQRVKVSYKFNATQTGNATGIGGRTATGTNTAGATQITAVSNTTGLQIGQRVVTQTSGYVGTITAIAGTTVTVSGPILNAQTTNPVFFYDAIWVDGVNYQVGGAGGIYTNTSGAVANTTPTATTAAITAYEVTPPEPGFDQTVILESVTRGGSTFQVRATHGDEMSPAVPLVGAATGLLSTNDVLPGAMAWTEPDEPEHCPPKNFARVGDATKAILGLVATRDRLLIFKEDGLYMLTGNTARDFGIYPLDTTCLCILPGSIRRLKNTVFVLTNLGLCAVDENGGVTVISRPIQLEVASIVNAIRAAQKASGLYNMPGLTGVTGAGDDAQGEYHLALGSSTPSFGGQVLVYSIPRDGFTTFTFGTPAPVALATDGEGQPLVLTASTLLTPSTALGAVTARVSPRGFTDPALLGKLWTHIAASFSKLTGTTSIQAKFTSSESQLSSAEATETLEAPTLAGLVELPNGSLLRHPLPRAVARAHMLFVELIIAVSNGTFTLEVIAAESRENASNKRPSHGSGAT